MNTGYLQSPVLELEKNQCHIGIKYKQIIFVTVLKR